jgi:NAD+--dinitrogen-reductase ADP-D-ribosyltransferase
MPSTPTASAEPGAGPAEDWYLRRAVLTRCNLAPGAIASQRFQDDPQRLEIAWVRSEHQAFLDLVALLPDAEERGHFFHEHQLSRFWLHEDPAHWPSRAERQRASYAAVLRGWGFDSDGPSGAVLKGWAEHRFGLRPIWHRTVLSTCDQARERYASQRMHGATTGIGMQLDLLYTFCQDELARRHPGQRWLTLYRGTHDAESYVVKRSVGREELVEFNTVSSFTADRETAWAFGSCVWEVRVPLAKVVYFTGLVPSGLLQGEAEYIVLGGDYAARVLSH